MLVSLGPAIEPIVHADTEQRCPNPGQGKRGENAEGGFNAKGAQGGDVAEQVRSEGGDGGDGGEGDGPAHPREGHVACLVGGFAVGTLLFVAMEGVQRIVDAEGEHQNGQEVRKWRPRDDVPPNETRQVREVADEALHPQQGAPERHANDGNVRPAPEADVQQDGHGQTHHDDEPGARLQFTVDLDVDALSNEQRDGGAVVRTQVAFKVHVGPFRGAASSFRLQFQALLAGVLRRMKEEVVVVKSVPTYPEPFVGELDGRFLMRILPHDLPPHFGELGAVELHEQPGGRSRPAAVGPQCIFPGAVGRQATEDGPLLVCRVVCFEATVKGNPTEEVVVRGLRHSRSGHVDVGLCQVDIVEFEAVQRKTIAPVGGRIRHHAQRCQAGLCEDRGVVHEPAEVVGERDGAVGLVARYVVDEGLEGRPQSVLGDQVKLVVDFSKHGEVEDTACRSVDAAPGLAGREHFGGRNQGSVVGGTVRHAVDGGPLVQRRHFRRIPNGDEETEDDFGVGEFLIHDGLRREFGRFHFVGFHVDWLQCCHGTGNHEQRQHKHDDVGVASTWNEPFGHTVESLAHGPPTPVSTFSRGVLEAYSSSSKNDDSGPFRQRTTYEEGQEDGTTRPPR